MDFEKRIREQQLLDKLQIVKSVNQDLTGFQMDDDITKGKMGIPGETRIWNGKEYKKRADGKWRPVAKGGGSKSETSEPVKTAEKEETKKVELSSPKSESVPPDRLKLAQLDVEINRLNKQVKKEKNYSSPEYNQYVKLSRERGVLAEKIFTDRVSAKKFKREKFISTPVEVGDHFWDENSRPGYYNERRLDSINGEYAQYSVISTEVNGQIYTRQSGITDRTANIQRAADKTARELHEKHEDLLEMTHEIVQKAGIDKIKGGELFGNFSAKRELERSLEKFKEVAQKFNTASKSFPAGPNSSIFIASASGSAVSYDFNKTHHGNYYEGSTPYAVQIRIGGALPLEQSRALRSAGKELLKKFSFTSPNGKGAIHETSGTNWTSVYLSSPSKDRQYFTL